MDPHRLLAQLALRRPPPVMLSSLLPNKLFARTTLGTSNPELPVNKLHVFTKPQMRRAAPVH
ncbi:hypothetical protein GN958_ATG08629 [Phytophthora infestans]|uniref:Uncharacterized protein n=1 Tax=Phytophthora infestans TaxID=4787 RepID=A0A8S9US75_PHYIN|nr:hypothetical protein GN958_ATG08629 [Phytophthora infestans]